MAIQKCRFCGAIPSSDTAKFCPGCGKSLEPLHNGPNAPTLPAAVVRQSTIRKPSKVMWFGINGALGCLLGALLGEIALKLLLPPPLPPTPPPKLDILFVLDVTGSMNAAYEGVLNGIGRFASHLESSGLDAREGLVAFSDRQIGEEPIVLSFDGQPFTANAEDFHRELAEVGEKRANMNGGDTAEESSLDALALAARQPFRETAKRIIILITDAPPLIPDKEISSVGEVIPILREHNINQLHLVIPDSERLVFGELQTAAPGQVFLLSDAAAGRSGFDSILPEISTTIVKGFPAIANKNQFSPESFWLVVVAYAVWTALLAIGISLSLIVGQNLYGRRHFLTGRQFLGGTIGAAFVGLAAGSIGQIIYAQGSGFPVARLIIWAVMGGLLGWGIASCVPNLQRKKGLQGGVVGGAIGAIWFMLLAILVGATAGRLLGATILGYCIGLMLAIVEIQSRTAWLEISRGSNEIWTVTLGEKPVRVGSNELCEVYARDIEPIALRYQTENDRLLCEEVSTGQISEIHSGDQRLIGPLSVTLRTLR